MVLALIRVFGIFLFLYLIWRKLRDDFVEDEVVSFSWIALVGFLLVGRVSYGLINWGVWNESWTNWVLFWQNPGFNYLFGYLGLWLTAFWYLKDKKWKTISVFEDMLRAVVVLAVALGVDEYIRGSRNIEVLYVMGVLVLVTVMSLVLGRKYRSFVWYKSGKKGFLWYFFNIFLFLFLGGLLLWLGKGMFWWIFSFLLSLISGVGLFILSSDNESIKILRRKNDKSNRE